jgi:hypothetical protein
MVGRTAIALLLAAFLVSPPLFASSIKKVKGTGVLIELDGDGSANVGDTFFAMDDAGKKKAIIEVTKVKGAQAIGNIKKGKAVAGMALVPRGGASKDSGAEAETAPTKESRRRERIRTLKEKSQEVSGGTIAIGALAGLSVNTMQLAAKNGSTTVNYDITGMGYGIGAMGDYFLSENLSARAVLGLERFAASGTPTSGTPCSNFTTNKCNTEITFFLGDLWARYGFNMGPGKLQLMGGLGVWFPSSYNTTALDAASINTMVVFGVGGGYDWKISDSLYVPLQLEYRFFPASTEVKTTVFGARIGLSFLM